MLVSQWDVDDTMVGEDAQGVISRHFLSTSGCTGRHEDPSVFPSESTGCPEATGRVPERLPLSGGISESSGNTEEESVVGGEDIWGDDWVVWFGRSVQQFQDVF